MSCHRAGTRVKISCSRVVAEARPQAQHVVQIGRREGIDGGKSAYEGFIVGYDGGDRCLLQHDLAEPDSIRIRRPSSLGAPGHVAAMAVIPGEQGASGEDGGRHAPGYDEATANRPWVTLNGGGS